MTILLYNNYELEERAAKHLKAWKVWHLIIFVCAAIFGITNYVSLQQTMALVNHNCVFYPRELAFQVVELPVEDTDDFNTTYAAELPTNLSDTNDNNKTKREAKNNETVEKETMFVTEENVTLITENATHRLVLDTSRTLFQSDSDCLFAEYMPLLSTVFAAVWITMFTMCAGGGKVKTGLVQPWRILAPALLFAVVMVGLAGRSFNITNGGLHAFCAEFYNITNSTTCSSVKPLLELGWNSSWGFGSRAALTRAASAGAWASWACAAALFVARCLAAPDFVVRRTGVYLARDPQQKVTPYLKKSRSGQRSNQSSPTKRETASLGSEPTATTELVTASVEHESDSAPSSVTMTPVRFPVSQNYEQSSTRTSATLTPGDAPLSQNTENIEMTYNPQERLELQR